MFEFIKKMFSTGLTILSSVNPLNATPFKCVSMTNQKCKGRPQIVNVNSDSDEQYFILLVLKQVNAVVVVIISMIQMQKCVFLMLLKMKQDTQNGMKHVSANVDYMQAFVIIKNVGMMINVGVNANN